MTEAGQAGGPHLDAAVLWYLGAGFALRRYTRVPFWKLMSGAALWEIAEQSPQVRAVLPWSRPDNLRDSLLEMLAFAGGMELAE